MSADMAESVETSKLPKIALLVAFVILVAAIGIGATRDSNDAESNVAEGATKMSVPGGDNVIASLEERTRKDPKDVEAWQLLGWSYFEAGRYGDAANAYTKATQLEPGRAVYWSSLGEALVMDNETDPMPKAAKAAFDRAIALDPKDPRSRYFQAVARDLTGDHDGAIADWLALLRDTPADAPWEADLVRTIEQVAQINKIDVTDKIASAKKNRSVDLASLQMGSVAAAPIPGPSKADMAAAAKLPPGQQEQMVASMVEGLEGKLAQNPANVDGWIMLMRSRMTLGQSAKASTALKKAVAANPAAESKLRREANILGVPGA
jgi:cytochrome c-type biogenesis protein CcmH